MTAPISQLFSVFKDENDHIDLVDLLGHMNQADTRLQNSSQLVITKLERIVQGRSSCKVTYQQLVQILDMNTSIKQNFDLIFQSLSGDEYITFEQLSKINNQFNLGLTRQQMQGMIRSVNPKADRVSKGELFEFLRDK